MAYPPIRPLLNECLTGNNGYAEQGWWTEEGWRWLQPDGYRYSWQKQGRITQPLRWDEPDWTADNQPVVSVSWYEAMTFCRWLDTRGRAEGWLPTEWEIGLPSEAEWEVAAQWDAKARAMQRWLPPDDALWQNCEEARIGRTSPVGMFPRGISPSGALDMAGNVWEWCASKYDDYPAKAHAREQDFPHNRYGPTIRGGVYSLQNQRSGWGARGRVYPVDLDLHGGFRIALRSRFAV